MTWLDKISYPMLLVAAVLMALAPMFPKPHLIEKLQMLREGTLSRPLDIFDLLFHSAPIVLLLVKVARDLSIRG